MRSEIEEISTPRSEIERRIKALQSRMDGKEEASSGSKGGMDGALLFHAVDICYFCGTAQDGLVYIPRDGEPVVMFELNQLIHFWIDIRQVTANKEISH